MTAARLRRTPLLAFAATIPCLAVGFPSGARAQEEPMESFIAVQSPTVALTNVKVIDGTGGPAREGQTIVIRDGRIADIGPADEVADRIRNAQVLDLEGHTVIPGLIGLHNHSYYTGGNGRAAQLSFSGSRHFVRAAAVSRGSSAASQRKVQVSSRSLTPDPCLLRMRREDHRGEVRRNWPG